ncbi:hypothetical protein NQ318_016559 [Aromia moschata]|uniref:MABP1/WDR62 second WD40 domain-containing protein n=1 Tax=Aromia moschata TaxID=1265417 RepID=A0AAV8YX28_9CUCU|nr:hypothetical protein NQ318_016559 [Aromia moschata]
MCTIHLLAASQSVASPTPVLLPLRPSAGQALGIKCKNMMLSVSVVQTSSRLCWGRVRKAVDRHRCCAGTECSCWRGLGPIFPALNNVSILPIVKKIGCTVVLFNTRTEQQSHIINTCRKTITSLAFSSCGRYIVTGECGHQPAVRVWDLQSDPQSGHPGLAPQPQQVAEFLGHKFGVNCVAFSPTSKYVVSVGTQHDMIVNVWDWKNNIKIASNKVSTKVKSIAFAENGSYFVTVGNRHVKFWYLEHGKAKYKEAVPLMGRSAILGEQRNNYFCDVACGKAHCGDSTYAITRSGLLCEFNNRRLLDKWVELREKSIYSVGCAEGIIRCFDPTTLRFITTLPRNHYLGVDVSLGTSIQHMASPPSDAKYPDTVAITFDETNNKLTSVYNDHSIYVWDIFNIQRVGKSFSFLYHSACIWGVEMAPANSPLPPGSFLTCSSDDTIRVWTLDKMNESNARGIYQQNIYSNELLKVVYVDKELSYIKDLDISGTNEKQDATSYDGRNGVRCIRISPDGKNLASGDRSGNIRIHDTATMRELCKIEAHDAEVLCLEYSDSNLGLMSSASRDRLIHVFDVKDGYDFVQTLDDHSSSITAVRFLNHGGNTQMVSCGADKSLIFRSLGELNGKPQFIRAHNATGKTTLYDMEVDTGQKHVLTACQDRNVRIYSVNNAKHTKSFKGSTGDDGTLIKVLQSNPKRSWLCLLLVTQLQVVLDRSGIYLATSCTDKSLSVYDYYSGECMATMCGHSELATGLRFTNDCRRLISASGDGCIFVWRVPHDMVVTMHARLSQQAMRQGKQLESEVFSDGSTFDFYDGSSAVDANYRFSIGQLPQWAKKQFTEDTSQPPSLTKGVAAPKGRWAQRAENAMGVKSFYSRDPFPFPTLERRADSDGGSKDSSLDSGTEVKQYTETRRETMTVSKVTTRVESRRGIMTDDSAIGDAESTAHDGDIDSDNEYRHRPIYYPSQGTVSGSEFTVTNIDADELRKSQRKKKAPQILIQQPSNYGSNDSDDDEDDASTPSGENTDRNPMSLFSLSSESLDQLVSRETNKTSISAKFLTRSGERNLEAINAVKQTKSDPDAIKKRQELNKRIAETKKKLESVGHSSPLKYSQSIHDLSHIPERDRWSKKQGNNQNDTALDLRDNGCFCDPKANQIHLNTSDFTPTNFTNSTDFSRSIPQSSSVPADLQLCGCYMRDIAKNTSQLSHILNLTHSYTTASSNVVEVNTKSLTGAKASDMVKSPEKTLNDLIRPRKLQLDKTLAKYKLHKSLPVSPVSEERRFSDYVEQKQESDVGRKSFSYFIDFEKKISTDEGFKQICSDIEKFSEDFNKKYEQLEQNFDSQIEGVKKNKKDDDDGNFSSDSLEDYSFSSAGDKKLKKTIPPRRCVSNNEIYNYQEEFFEEIPKITDENTIEMNYKEKFIEKDLETSNHKGQNIFNELYDSLDKKILNSKMDFDSLEVNLNTQDADQKLYDSLEKNVTTGKVRALSSMYESMTSSQSYYNDLTKLQATPVRFRRRNLSLPSFVERRLNFETKVDNKNADKNVAEVAKTEDSGPKHEVYLDESSPDSSLRRSCSLSDLSMQMPVVPKRKIDQGKKATNTSRNNSRYIKNASITRSRSSGVLNQSDSDPDTQEKKVSRLMRPTISSHNKINNKSLQSRKKHSYSTSNINTIGTTDNISTSDDELPTAPPRSRNYDNGQPTITPRRHLNNKEKSRASRHTIHFDDTLTNEDIDSNESISSVEISNQLCDDLIDQLTSTAEKVVKLYDRLNETDDGNESQIERIDRVKMSMIRTHKVLHDCIFRELKQNNGGIDVNQTDTVKKLNDLVSKGQSGPNSVINIMEQYSDILLDMVQQKIHNANI